MLLLNLHLLQSHRQLLLLSLLLSLVEELGILRPLVMDTTLGLRGSLPASSSLVLTLLHGLSGMPITDTLVTTVVQLIVWNVVMFNVLVDLAEGPASERVDLDQASIVNLNDVEGLALCTLRASAAGEDCCDREIGICSVRRLYFGSVVVVVGTMFPELRAVLSLELSSGVDALGLVDVEIDVWIARLHLFDQIQSFLKMIEGVEEDNVDWGGGGRLFLQLREDVKGHETRHAKRGCLVEVGKRDL